MAYSGIVNAEMSAGARGTMRRFRNDFPVLRRKVHGDKPFVFLDSAASAQKPRAVVDTMSEIMYSGYANIHRGLYEVSQELTAQYEGARTKVASFIGAKSDKEIVFTRNATEGINLVAQSWGRTFLSAGDEIILTEMEHHANIVPWQLLEKQTGVVIRVVPVQNSGALDVQALDSLLSDKTKMVAFTHVSNALGVINPAKKIIERVKKYNSDICVLVDGSQSAVHMSVDVQDLGCDFFVLTAHKLYGPTGVGVLYGRYDVLDSMPPYQGGGDMIEHVSFEKTTFKEPPFRFEAGTPAIVQVVGFCSALEYVDSIGFEAIQAHEQELLRIATMRLKDIDGITLYGDVDDKAGILSFNIDGVHASDVGMILDQCGVAVRTGHHCCMPLMSRLGVNASVRASLGLYSNSEDLEAFDLALKKAKDMLV